ncbi:MAG: alpha/beta fold hydrolase [Gammaproteobacteria bacterium]|nr:alpha/beta fold hydrolase [Gammaproteobacteria bacterium]
MRLLLALGAGVAVIAGVALWLIGSILARPAPAVLGPPPAGLVEAQFESRSGATLKAWVAPVAAARAAAVLMHPLGGNRQSMLGRVRLMNSLGVAALAFDFSAHGESTGENISFGYLESRDARAAVRFARERWPGLPVFVIGVSLGGVAALLADPPLEVEGMILESVYPEISTATSNRLALRFPYAELATPLLVAQLPLRLGIDAEELAPVNRARFITVPVLLMSGSRDRRTTEADTRRLFAAFPGRKRLVLFEGASHQNLRAFDRPTYDATVSAFVEELWSRLSP